MRPNGIRLPPVRRYALYGTFAVLFATGALWFVLHDAGDALGLPSGNTVESVLPSLMSLHGAVAMLGLLLLGSLGPQHIVWAWRARTNRATGSVLILVQLLLVVTGYLLYYAGGENLRWLSHWLHLLAGFTLPACIAWHVFEGRRLRRAVRVAGRRREHRLVG